MDLSTLIAARERTSPWPDGDRQFVHHCVLGRNGQIALYASIRARREADDDGLAADSGEADVWIADRIIELVGGLDPATQNDPDAAFVQLHEFGSEAWRAARGDRAFALWLFAVGTEFQQRVRVYPHDVNHSDWRAKYTAGLDARTAVKVALHEQPMVTINERNQLVCPVCTVTGEIAEEDEAVRLNTLHVDDGGEIYAHTGDANFEHRRFLCRACGTTVRLPRPIEDRL